MTIRDTNTPVPLEGPSSLLLLFRVEAGKVERLRTLAPDCLLDAGGVPFFWLDHVNPAESVAMLESLLKESPKNPGSFVYGIAATKDSSSEAALKRLVETTQPEVVRRAAINWLADTSDGVPLTIAIARRDKDEKVRRAAVNALARSRDPRAVRFFEDTLAH